MGLGVDSMASNSNPEISMDRGAVTVGFKIAGGLNPRGNLGDLEFQSNTVDFPSLKNVYVSVSGP